jgi:hypothetical protein
MLRNNINHMVKKNARIGSNSKIKEEYYDQNVEIIMYIKIDIYLHFLQICCDQNV